MGARPRAEDASVLFSNPNVVDARLAANHQPVLVEFPQLVAVASPPLAVTVMALVLEAHGDPVFVKAPQVLAQGVIQLTLPFRGEEGDDLGSTRDEGVSVAPDGVLAIGEGDPFRVASIPGVF